MEALRTCRAKSPTDRTDCYKPFLVSLASRPEIAMGALNRLGAMDPEVRRNGHLFAHAIGMAAYREDASPTVTFRRCTDAYQSGCYHGVIQAYFQHARSGAAPGELSVRQVNDICRPFRAETPDGWLLFTCVHGIGHGLTQFYRHDLPRALRACDLMTLDWDRQACYGGAFMENIVNVLTPHHGGGGPIAHAVERPAEVRGAGDEDLALSHGGGSGEHSAGSAASGSTTAGLGSPAAARVPDLAKTFKALEPKDLHYPCSIVDRKYLAACYLLQTSAILPQNGWDFAAAARTCDSAPRGFRGLCYQSLGRDASAYALTDPATAIGLCRQGAPSRQPWCYAGAVKDIAYGPGRLERGFAFCGLVAGTAGKSKCYEALGEDIGVLEATPPARAALCEGAERPYVDACRFGARLTQRSPDALPEAG